MGPVKKAIIQGTLHTKSIRFNIKNFDGWLRLNNRQNGHGGSEVDLRDLLRIVVGLSFEAQIS